MTVMSFNNTDIDISKVVTIEFKKCLLIKLHPAVSK